MRFARIKDGKIQNIIILNDLELIPLFSEGYDLILEVSGEPGSPDVGWSYSPDTGFTNPVLIL